VLVVPSEAVAVGSLIVVLVPLAEVGGANLIGLDAVDRHREPALVTLDGGDRALHHGHVHLDGGHLAMSLSMLILMSAAEMLSLMMGSREGRNG